MAEKITEPFKDSAFLLRSVAYGDDHLILSFLTVSRGRVDAIALGAKKSRKRFSGILDFVHCLDIEFQPSRRGGLMQLLNCELRETYDGLRSDYDATMVALGWIRLLSKVLPEGQNIPGLFALLQDGFRGLAARRSDWVDVIFLRSLLSRLGFYLELSRCVRCRNDGAGDFFFHASDGGLVCAICHQGSSLRPLSGVIPPLFWEEDSDWEAKRSFVPISRRIFAEGFKHYLGVEISE
ncbi:MAG: DNA repair protein RecO [Deltaproteobacteria bacterium]|nr:DNA repair protein RecO [Deltaproteobacteria bacterium]